MARKMLLMGDSLFLEYRHLGTFEPFNKMSISDSGDTPVHTGYAVSFSRGIRRIRHIGRFLQVADVVSPLQAWTKRLDVTCVVVWGRKQNSQRALQYAARRQLSVLFVEDGWIRSCSANPHSRVSYSLLVDELGVYYDATGRPLVLVIDQTLDDASVRFGGMDSLRFSDMLDRAVDENPESRVLVRTHPDVVAGQRKGYLQARAQELGVEISAAGDNPLPWLKQAETVYVGTSQLGYEALLCGCTVKVAGKPFYAGWGLTEDIQSIDRRTQRRSLDQMFYATHIHQVRYCCPVTGKPWTLADCIDHVELQLSYFLRNVGNHVCVGITPWKKRYFAQFFRSPYGRIRFSKRNDASEDECPVYWSFTDANEDETVSGNMTVLADKTFTHTVKKTRVEDGFIRSKGLGSDFTPPTSLVFDDEGLYFDASGPSALEQLLNTYECSNQEVDRAKKLRASLLSTRTTKYNVGVPRQDSAQPRKYHTEKKSILVVGQVEGDQSILRGSIHLKSNAELLAAVRAANPDAYVVYKPHPDVVSGNRNGKVSDSVIEALVNRVEIAQGILDCLDQCDELHTMTSQAGFEAILRNKVVVTYGAPFYAGWGLTRDQYRCERRRECDPWMSWCTSP